MGKIKSWYRSIPLWLAFFLFAAAALVISSILANRVTDIAVFEMGKISSKYLTLNLDPEAGGGERPIVEGDGWYVLYDVDLEGMASDRRYVFFNFLSKAAPPVIYSCFLLGAAFLFYITKLKKPLTLLQNAYRKIAQDDFDFSLDYSGRDEMAKLCGAFERMRLALDENNRRMRRMIDERKQLNDAYTHDIRTPIAILKGYTGILTKFLPTGQLSMEKVIATANTMAVQVERLEEFAGTMNTVQKLTDLTIRRERVSAGDFAASLRETAAMLSEKHVPLCDIDAALDEDTLNIDPAVVTQVFENLLGNALRFAKERITVRVTAEGQMLSLQVRDDGRGFTERELSSPSRPYCRGEQTDGDYHFGLGLYICRTLCERHGGSLQLANAETGGALVTASFSMDEDTGKML